MATIEDKIEEKLLTANFAKGRNGWQISAVVLHITDGLFGSALNTFQNPASQVSAHYLVGEGKIYRLVKDEDTAWHCGRIYQPTYRGLKHGVNSNLYTIGIELAGKPKEFPAVRDLLNGAKIIKELASKWNIPLNEIGVINHNEINQGKECPGRWFNRDFLSILWRFNIV